MAIEIIALELDILHVQLGLVTQCALLGVRIKMGALFAGVNNISLRKIQGSHSVELDALSEFFRSFSMWSLGD